MSANSDSADPSTFISLCAKELRRRLAAQGIHIPTREMRAKLAEALVVSGVAPTTPITRMALRRFGSQKVITQVEAAIAAALAEGRSRGGTKGSKTHRRRRRARAREWWRQADKMNSALTLAAKARLIADRETRRRPDDTSWRTVYDALRRYRPKKKSGS